MSYKPNIHTRVSENLSTNDNNFSHDNNLNLPRNDRPGLIPRIGKTSIAILLSSFAVCFGCLAFLTFLWVADTNNTIWRKIVVSGWTTRAITISALALRWATATQAINCTSMLAAVLLQSYAVPLPSAAAVSIMRFGNTGPWSLLGKMKTKWHSGSFPIGLLAVLLTFTTLSLQFTSTALLSQVGLAALPIQVTVPQTFYSTDPNGATFKSYLGEGAPFIQTTPKGYPAFAEWVSNSTGSEKEFAPSSSPGMVDTGTVMRAFLPINDTNERSRLTDYQGYATVVDMRVVCMRPKLTNVVFSSRSGTRLTGVINNEQKPLGLAQSIYYKESSDFAWEFECGFGAAGQTDYIERYGWPLTLCETTPRHSTEGM